MLDGEPSGGDRPEILEAQLSRVKSVTELQPDALLYFVTENMSAAAREFIA